MLRKFLTEVSGSGKWTDLDGSEEKLFKIKGLFRKWHDAGFEILATEVEKSS